MDHVPKVLGRRGCGKLYWHQNHWMSCNARYLFPSFWLINPLMCVDRHLCTQGFCQHQHLSSTRTVRKNNIVLGTDTARYSTHSAPRVKHSLTTSHKAASLTSCVLEPFHH